MIKITRGRADGIGAALEGPFHAPTAPITYPYTKPHPATPQLPCCPAHAYPCSPITLRPTIMPTACLPLEPDQAPPPKLLLRL